MEEVKIEAMLSGVEVSELSVRQSHSECQIDEVPVNQLTVAGTLIHPWTCLSLEIPLAGILNQDQRLMFTV